LKTKIPETKYSWAALRCDILGSECGASQEHQQQKSRGARADSLTGNEPDPRWSKRYQALASICDAHGGRLHSQSCFCASASDARQQITDCQSDTLGAVDKQRITGLDLGLVRNCSVANFDQIGE
jgi:hypothetical protein